MSNDLATKILWLYPRRKGGGMLGKFLSELGRSCGILSLCA